MSRKKRVENEPDKTGMIATASPPAAAAVLQVKTWIVEGQQAADILEAAKDSFPNERPDVVLSAALESLGTESAEIDVDVARGFLLEAYREMYRRAAEINDFGNALAALRAFERQIPK